MWNVEIDIKFISATNLNILYVFIATSLDQALTTFFFGLLQYYFNLLVLVLLDIKFFSYTAIIMGNY